MKLFKDAGYVSLFSLTVAIIGILTLSYKLPIGPIILGLSVVPGLGIFLAKKSLVKAIPDIIFGALDTGLLTIPALWGGYLFGVAGAIAGGIIGDAITDSIAGFFEGSISEWFRQKGIEESREAVTTALGKMGGCLLGSGLVLTAALLLGITPKFN
ncbi:MAG: hypothetical protein ACP5FK_10865 [bacterium]